jgi:glycolate oxidase
MKGLLVVRRGNLGAFFNRIDNLASGTRKVNNDANHERITALFCKRTPEPRLQPPFANCDTVSKGRGEITFDNRLGKNRRQEMKDSADKINRLQEEMVGIVGPGWVSRKDTSLIVQPRTAEEVSSILRKANQARIPVRPKGGGTGWWSSTQPPEGGILLHLTRMNEVITVNEDVMSVTVEAGITFDKLDEVLSAKGYRIVLFPESGKVATMGGHIQTWGTAPHSSSVYEDQATQVLGLKVVLPTGEIIPTGTGAVTTAGGHFARRFFPADLTGLFLGCEGGLGVIVQAALKIHRQPEVILMRIIGFRKVPPLIHLLRRIQEGQRGGGLATLVEQRVVPKEMMVTAIPRLQAELAQEVRYLLVLRVEGDRDDAERHLAKACAFAAAEGGEIAKDEIPEWWAGRFVVQAASLGKGQKIMIVAFAPFGRLQEAFALTEEFGKKHDLKLGLIGYPFGGPVLLAHAVIPWEGARPETRERALAQAREFMEALVRIGCVPHRVGTDFLPVLAGKLDPGYYDFVKRIKRMLDPNGIMNPGVLVSA